MTFREPGTDNTAGKCDKAGKTPRDRIGIAGRTIEVCIPLENAFFREIAEWMKNRIILPAIRL